MRTLKIEFRFADFICVMSNCWFIKAMQIDMLNINFQYNFEFKIICKPKYNMITCKANVKVPPNHQVI